MELHGVTGAPYKHPETRRSIPAAFQRPSISAGGAPVKRTWKRIAVLDVQAGDILANVGEVTEVSSTIAIPSMDRLQEAGFQPDDVVYTVTVTNILGTMYEFGGEHTVLAFTAT